MKLKVSRYLREQKYGENVHRNYEIGGSNGTSPLLLLLLLFSFW